MNEEILRALQWRYGVKAFDSSKAVSEKDFTTILESARLAPSCFGIEPWVFVVVENPEVRARLREVGYGQPKITDASKLVVVARRTDARAHIADELVARTAVAQGVEPSALEGLHSMVAGSVAGRSDEQLDAWVRAQTYIPLGMMIETAALLGVDAGPMEGFDVSGVDEVLGLKEKSLTATTMIAFGYRGEDTFAHLPKVRRSADEVFQWVK